MSATYSAYRIKWVVIDNYSKHIWKYQEKALEKLGFGVLRQTSDKSGVAMKHYRDDDAVKADADNIKAAWAVLCKKAPGVGAVITDKQFSMINPKNIKSAIMLSTTKQRELFISIL